MSDFLDPDDWLEAGQWLERQATAAAPREPSRPVGRHPASRSAAIHLLVGDSIGRDVGLGSRLRGDVMLNRCRGGATSGSILQHVDFDLAHWDVVAAAEQIPKGSAVYWVSANDVYSRYTGCGNIDPEQLEFCGMNVKWTIQRLLNHASRVVVLGPLPRLDGDLPGIAWEKTAAFHLERSVKRVVEAFVEQEGSVRVKFVPLGRYLTKKQGGRHAMRMECAEWYRDDRVHLSRAGYKKIADAEHLPVWLNFEC